MIDLGETNFYIAIPSLPQHELEKYSTNLFDEWESYIEKTLKLPDYALSLQVEEGSIKGSAKIAAVLGALYLGIGQYGSFISGLQTIKGQISSIGDFLGSQANAPFPSTKPRVKKHFGSLGQLHKLFMKVQQGKITADQAIIAAEVILGEEVSDSPDFMKKLKTTIKETPLQAQQLALSFDSFDQQFTASTSEKKQQPRKPRPKPESPINQQYRIEVWRESKKEKRKFRLVQI